MAKASSANKPEVVTTIRLPGEQYRRMMELAKHNHRSFSAQMRFEIERVLAAEDQREAA